MTAAPGGRPDPADPAPGSDRSLARQRGEVIAALGRLAEGAFGRCEICGVQISDRRLRLAPAADRCMNHLLRPSPRPGAPARGNGPPGPAHSHHPDRADGADGADRREDGQR